MPFDDIIKDSSVWRDNYSFQEHGQLDTTIRIGIVRAVNFNKIDQEAKYIVEVQSESDRFVVSCKLMTRLGGVYNSEEYTLQTYKFDKTNDRIGKFDTKAGDMVLVTFLNGDPREGVILGGISHTARKAKFDPADGPQHFVSTNGIEQEINKEGEYILTFRGQPTNAKVLTDKPNDKPIPEAEYDDEVGTTFMKFDLDGGWTVSDNATENPQSIHVDKVSGTITITSGAVVLSIAKEGEAVSLTSKTLNINATDSVDIKTKEWSVEASETAKMKSPKIAIGGDGTELLDQIVQLIDALGSQTIITPVGPASPVMASPQWAKVEKIKSAITGIKGSL
ncbi:MAG: hypothetical protein DRQ89_12815 [Epsilonproteobacteria bacterium]|nr:MAG: hypothetical protein DRQ89_12815 [Campylobacterota bacterium]